MCMISKNRGRIVVSDYVLRGAKRSGRVARSVEVRLREAGELLRPRVGGGVEGASVWEGAAD